ncbi:MAG: 30S ribosomal protein S19 [Candidatus Dojkabacteria bacterium]|nr:30S ribosomal protein S19 [Candidatus Dojkabacteria bacterium]
MSRSLKKGPYVDKKLLSKVKKMKEKGENRPIKTWARDCTITPDMIGCSFDVHNGKNFIRVYVTESMVGYKLGDFAPTTKFISHGGAKARAESKQKAQ